MVLLWLELWTAYLNACILRGLGGESGAMVRVLHCWSSSRSSLGRVTVIIIRIFSYTGFLKPRILRGLGCDNCDMARVLALLVLLSFEFWTCHRDYYTCFLVYGFSQTTYFTMSGVRKW